MTSTAGKNKRKTISSRNKSPYTTDDENGTTNINDTKSMFTEIMSELKNIKKQNDEFIQETREEIKSIKDELTKRNEKWDEICSSLEMKITNAENKIQ